MTIIVKGNHEAGYNTTFSNEPELPTTKHSHAIDKEQAALWVQEHQPETREALTELLREVKHIAYKTFNTQLGKSIKAARIALCARLSLEKASQLTDRMIVLVENSKSNQWVAELACRYFDFKASEYYRLGDKDAKKFRDHLDQSSVIERKSMENKVIVLFDDGSYSGTQLTNHMVSLLQVQKELKFDSICVIVPFMTDFAHQKLVDTAGKMIERVLIAPFATIPTVATNLDAAHIQTLNQLWWSKEDKNEKANTRGLYWFDHKIPNGMSFPETLEKGNVIRRDGAVVKNTYKILPEVNEPYKS